MNTLFAPAPRSELNLVPRDYQVEDLEESLRLWDSGVTGTLTRAATGLGKTPMACMCADAWLARGPDYRVMVISYETQLVWQFAEEIQYFMGITPAIEMSAERVEGRIPKITVASRQSLMLRDQATQQQRDWLAEHGVTNVGLGTLSLAKKVIKAMRSGLAVDEAEQIFAEFNASPVANQELKAVSRLYKFDNRLNWLIVWDESHKYTLSGKTTGPIYSWFSANPLTRHKGLTATPKRYDGKSLAHMFPGVSLEFPMTSLTGRSALKEGYAVPYIQRYVEVEGVDFASLRKMRSETGFDEERLESLLLEEERLAALCDPLLDMVEDRKTLIFSPGVEMAKAVAAFINVRSDVRCACGKRAWYPTNLIGDGAVCKACGEMLTPEQVIKGGPQAQALWGEVPHVARKEVYRGHREGKFQFLSVCSLCVAKGTMITTDHGLVKIEDVTRDMKVWDGFEWVYHGGVIFQGVKPVIEYAGLMATPDHHVWCGRYWRSLNDCKVNRYPIAVGAVGTHAVFEYASLFRTHREHLLETFDQERTSEAEVYDILNAGPRNRFTANGLIVSNCREGFNDPEISCVAVFRPISKKASALAEQMKGRASRPLRGLIEGMSSAEERLEAIANSSKPNCIAEGTPILTDQGLVPIERVTRDMKVWDGIEFVAHCGIIYRGNQVVIEYAGLTATPDHEVWTHENTTSETRTTLGNAAAKQIALRVTGIGGKEVREADRCYRRDHQKSVESCHDFDRMRLWNSFYQVVQRLDSYGSRLSKVRTTSEISQVAMAEMCVSKAAVCTSKRRGVFSIRRSRNSFQLRISRSHVPVGDGQSRTAARDVSGSDQQRRTLRAGKSSIRNKPAELLQHEETKSSIGNARLQDRASRDSVLRQRIVSIATSRSDVERHCRKNKTSRTWTSPSVQRTARVFDILNAGPRHRFTASGVLVSNCLVIDMTGVTSLPDCVSTVQLYAEGLPDEVIKRAEQYSLEGGMDNVMELIERAERDINKEREEARLAREKAEADRKEEARKRALAQAQARYSTHQQGSGTEYNRDPGFLSEGQEKMIAFYGMKFVGWLPTKKQASRIIGQLKEENLPCQRVAYLNRIGDEQWVPTHATIKQVQFLSKRGVNAQGMTPYRASCIIDKIMAGKKPVSGNSQLPALMAELSAISESWKLDEFRDKVKGMLGQLTPAEKAELFAAGKKKREEVF